MTTRPRGSARPITDAPQDTELLHLDPTRHRYTLTPEARQKRVEARIEAMEISRWENEISLAGLRGELESRAGDDPERGDIEQRIIAAVQAVANASAAIRGVKALPIR